MVTVVFYMYLILISLLLFVSDMILCVSLPKGLQKENDALSNLCDLQQLTLVKLRL